MKSKNQETLFIETIKLQSGRLQNVSYHNSRANTARREILGIDELLNLAAHITIPKAMGRGVYKCRVTFGHEVMSCEFEKYRRRSIKRIKLIEGGAIDYRHKYADRSDINALFSQRGDCDDILIVKDGFITDTSYANVAFYDGKVWYTPSTPLLAGTKRQQLLDTGMLKPEPIRISDVKAFSHIVLFNAMLEFDPREAIKTEAVLSLKVD